MSTVELFFRNVLLVVEWAFLSYFIYTVTYSVFFSVAAFFFRDPIYFYTEKRKIAVFIPAYKEDGVIVSVAKEAVQHNYPNDKFDVFVIADSLRIETIEKLNNIDNLHIIKVDFELSTKVKALNVAINQIENNYEIAVILDADNLMENDFLNHINGAFSKGITAIQGQRMAKNKSTPMAFLDALSESINNRIYRQGTSALGLSCSFIGSGIAIKFDLFKKVIGQMNAIGGFDRDMEVRLIEYGVKVQYLKRAIVLDEKVNSTEVFENQRKRWIYSQYHYLFRYFGAGLKGLMKGNISYFNSTILRNIQLPRVLNVGLLALICFVLVIFPQGSSITAVVWYWLFAILLVSNLISIPTTYYGKEFIKALLTLPKVFVIMFLLLFKLKKAKTSFIHTPHAGDVKSEDEI